MATRSTIAIERANGTVAQVYCHWDGYLDNNGKILHEHYQTPEKIEQLISLGNISSLRSEIGEQHEFDATYSRSDPQYNWTRFYGRDRQETDVDAIIYNCYQDYVKDGLTQSYNYLFRHGQWWVHCKHLGDGQFFTIPEALVVEKLNDD